MSCRNDRWSGREWKGGKMEEVRQEMKVIEKTRWEGGKTIEVKSEKKNEERNG